MNALAWLGLFGALVVWLVPAPGSGRAPELAAAGRLRAGGSAPPGKRRWLLPARALVLAAGTVSTSTVYATLGPVLAVAAAAVTALVGVLTHDRIERRRDAARRRALRVAVGVLVGELEAGAQPAAAMDSAAASDSQRQLPALHAATGAGPDAGDADLEPLAVAWRLAERTGAPLAGVLARVQGDLVAAEEQRRTVAVVLAGPRSSAVVLAGLPAVGIALGAAMGAHPLAFVVSDPVGRLVGCVGVLLDVAGVAWMRALVRRAEVQ